MLLNKVIYTGTSDIAREMVCTPWGAFYKTSSTNSPKNLEGTWMPFHYVQEKDEGIFLKRNYLVKFTGDHYLFNIPLNIADKVEELFPSARKEACARFATLSCLLLSSILEGGLWNTENGKKLKSLLEEKYPRFYQLVPKIQFANETANVVNDPIAINQWLVKEANVKTTQDLSKQFLDYNALIDALLKLEQEQLVKTSKVLIYSYDNKKAAATSSEAEKTVQESESEESTNESTVKRTSTEPVPAITKKAKIG